MTLDEAIKHSEEQEEFEIAKWLRELKGIKDRRGEWLKTSDGYPFCSICGHEVSGVAEYGTVKGRESDFCPHCGVKMIRKKGDKR